MLPIFLRYCYFLQNGPKLAQFFSFKAIFSLSAKFSEVGTFSMWKYTSVRTPIHWWQLRHAVESIQKTLLLLLNSLLYNNLGSGSNPGFSNKISWPKLIFSKVLNCLGVLICPILHCIKLWAKSKISFYRPYLHCDTFSVKKPSKEKEKSLKSFWHFLFPPCFRLVD